MKHKAKVLICGGTNCISKKSLELKQEFEFQCNMRGMGDSIKCVVVGCLGICEQGPNIMIYPEGTIYSKIKMDDVKKIVSSHLFKGKIVKELQLKKDIDINKLREFNEKNFFEKQQRIALRNCGIINPEDIREYIAKDGYLALGMVLTEMTPKKVIDIVKKSGLRGRGGGGFPTGVKWEFANKMNSEQKYLICNADEGDPGAFMDRSILEGDPHSLIEAMIIGGYAIGASIGHIYVRAEYPVAIERLNQAIKQAYEYGFLGEKIYNTKFNFDLDVRLGAGAFVCGEETALLNSVEGKRGEPRFKPPFPAVKGLWQKPSIINNVETYANIPPIIVKGYKWFSSIGTEKSKGTKVFALGGKIKNTGLVEVPMGTTLREIIYDIGGGIPEDKDFKAAQTGGPSGGVITEKNLDIKIDYESLSNIGSMMGSGGLIIMDEENCMVDIAKFYLGFTRDESCGKCTPCRIGTTRMLELLEKITQGKGEPIDIQKLKELGEMIKDTSLCGLGQSAPNPVLSTLEYFPQEYTEHVYEKKCRSKKCDALLKYRIIESKCIGCTLCKKVCPVDCILGKPKEAHVIDEDKCITCGACAEKCPTKAIVR